MILAAYPGVCKQFCNLVRKRKSSSRRVRTEQNLFECCQLFCVDLSRIDLNRSSGLVARYRNGGSRNLPAERQRFGRIIYCCMATLRRSCLAAINEVKLVTVVVAICVGTDKGLVCETKTLTSLLTDAYALCNFSASVTLREFVGVCIRLDRRCVLFNGIQIKVLTVVSPQCGSLGARRGLRNVCYTIPSYTSAIYASGVLRLKSYGAYTCLKQLLAGLIPYQGCKSSHIVYPP